MKRLFYALFWAFAFALLPLSAENNATLQNKNATNSQNNANSKDSNSTNADLNISKGQAIILQFSKQGLKDIKSLTNLSQKPRTERVFAHPSDANKVVLVFSSAYKKPIASAEVAALYADGQTLKYHLLGVDGDYEVENLSVEPSKISPPKAAQQRIAAELKEANAVYATYTNKALYKGEFVMPINSAITSKFGSARVFNGTLKSYHGGTDFRAAVGTPVVAANDGIVRLAKDRYYAGGSVIIDHGYRIFTQYYHLSELKVAVGQRVKKGQVIALSGDTGRVTGAHLHFGIFAGGAQVDPLDFIEKFNALFRKK